MRTTNPVRNETKERKTEQQLNETIAVTLSRAVKTKL